MRLICRLFTQIGTIEALIGLLNVLKLPQKTTLYDVGCLLVADYCLPLGSNLIDYYNTILN